MNKSLKKNFTPLRITFQSRDNGFFFMALLSLNSNLFVIHSRFSSLE